MAESTIPTNLEDLVHTLARFFRWWKEGLRSCIPYRFYTLLVGEQKQWVLELNTEGAVARCLSGENEVIQQMTLSGPDELHGLVGAMGKKVKQTVLSIVLPDEWVLCKSVSLPTAASRNLTQVLSYEMDRLTPFRTSDVYFDYSADSSASVQGHIQVKLAVVQRDLIDSWIDGVLRANIRLQAISADGGWDGISFTRSIDRLKTQKISNQGRFRRILVFSALLLGVAVFVSPLLQMRSVVVGLNDRVASAKRKAEVILKLRSQIEEAESTFNYVVEQKKQSVPVIQVLDSVTKLLPDDTWVQQLDLKGDMLEIRGVSGRATQLIKLFEDSVSFSDAAFRSPVVQARNDSRYHMAAKLVVSGAE